MNKEQKDFFGFRFTVSDEGVHFDLKRRTLFYLLFTLFFVTLTLLIVGGIDFLTHFLIAD